MGYFLTTRLNSNGIIKYEDKISPHYSLFMEGIEIGDLELPLTYSIVDKPSLNKIQNFHMISSSGPELISDKFREVIEKNAQNDIEFYDVKLLFEDEEISGFSAINLKYKIPCVNLEQSEFKITNFDRSNPNYWFYYTVVDQIESDIQIARCKEMGRRIFISENLKEACILSNLKGLTFNTTIDITPKCRTKGISI